MNNGNAEVKEYVCSAKNTNGVSIISYLNVNSIGTGIQQYQSVKKCHTCWLFFSCCDNVNEPRGYSTQEVLDM